MQLSASGALAPPGTVSMQAMHAMEMPQGHDILMSSAGKFIPTSTHPPAVGPSRRVRVLYSSPPCIFHPPSSTAHRRK